MKAITAIIILVTWAELMPRQTEESFVSINNREKLFLDLYDSGNFYIHAEPNGITGWSLNRFYGNWRTNDDTLFLDYTKLISNKNERELRNFNARDSTELREKYIYEDSLLKLISTNPIAKVRQFKKLKTTPNNR